MANFHNITHDDMRNGEGLRVVLWLSGCSHHCKECQNPITWDPNIGLPLTDWEMAEFWEWLDKSWTQGATFSGGDPLHPVNRAFVGQTMEHIKDTRPDKDIWVYTGYELKHSSEGFYFEDENGETFFYAGLQYIDVLVDGMFDCDVRKADILSGKKVLWCGSSNQRIIDIRESLERKNIVQRIYNQDGSYELMEVKA